MAAAATAAFLFFPKFTKPYLLAAKSPNSIYTPLVSACPLPNLASPSPSPSPSPACQKSSLFIRFSAVQDIAAEEEAKGSVEENQGETEKKSKLYVVNLPWDYTDSDVEKLFDEFGTVRDVEIIKQKNGKSRGYAFITMRSNEEARAAIEKLDSSELLGRIIRVELAKRFDKPSPPPPVETVVETRHKIYASNLAWKVRSVNLRNFFSAKFKPVSARVVFDSPSGKSAGYGFVSFATKEEAEAALCELDGKELMGRPLRLRIGPKNDDESGSEADKTDST